MIEEVKEGGWMKGGTLLVPSLSDRWRGWLLSVCEPRQMRAGPWGLGFTCSPHALTGKTPARPTPIAATASQSHAELKPFFLILCEGSF